MNFLPNTVVIWTVTNIAIKEAWEAACQQVISMIYVPTLTGGMEGQHSLESGHYHGRALDFRSKDVPFELRMPLKNRVQELLGADYLVLLEDNHFHVQRQKESF